MRKRSKTQNIIRDASIMFEKQIAALLKNRNLYAHEKRRVSKVALEYLFRIGKLQWRMVSRDTPPANWTMNSRRIAELREELRSKNVLNLFQTVYNIRTEAPEQKVGKHLQKGYKISKEFAEGSMETAERGLPAVKLKIDAATVNGELREPRETFVHVIIGMHLQPPNTATAKHWSAVLATVINRMTLPCNIENGFLLNMNGEDCLSEILDSIDISGSTELSTKRGILHVHLLIRATHYGRIQVNTEYIKQYVRDEMNKAIPLKRDKLTGKPYYNSREKRAAAAGKRTDRVYINWASQVRGGGEAFFPHNEKPWVTVHLLPDSFYMRKLRDYIRKQHASP